MASFDVDNLFDVFDEDGEDIDIIPLPEQTDIIK